MLGGLLQVLCKQRKLIFPHCLPQQRRVLVKRGTVRLHDRANVGPYGVELVVQRP